MAKKPAAAAHVEELPPAMDYAQHEATYRGFLGLVKWGIVSIAFVVLALYAFIEGHNPIVGAVLVLLAIVVPVGGALMSGRTSNA